MLWAITPDATPNDTDTKDPNMAVIVADLTPPVPLFPGPSVHPASFPHIEQTRLPHTVLSQMLSHTPPAP